MARCKQKEKIEKMKKCFTLHHRQKEFEKNEKITLIECPLSFEINFPFSQNFLLFRQIYRNVTIEKRLRNGFSSAN